MQRCGLGRSGARLLAGSEAAFYPLVGLGDRWFSVGVRGGGLDNGDLMFLFRFMTGGMLEKERESV